MNRMLATAVLFASVAFALGVGVGPSRLAEGGAPTLYARAEGSAAPSPRGEERRGGVEGKDGGGKHVDEGSEDNDRPVPDEDGGIRMPDDEGFEYSVPPA